jgi:hypothetical protein
VSILDAVFHAGGERRVTLLALLDLSAAFDTVDHAILSQRLSSIGITGNALKWISDYLSDRSQSTVISESISSSMSLRFGVPQGSVLGPILFTIYLLGLRDIVLSP